MTKIRTHTAAPDFALQDFRGKTIHLSDFQGQKIVLLVFNRGFL
ncbi:MAG TPA: redoxin domain-containing protein [Anaerolineales bacterium]